MKPNSVRERVDTEIDKVLKEYDCLNKSEPNSITTLQGRLSEVIITTISEEVGKMKDGFEDFLVEKHAEQFIGTKDVMVDDFEKWLCEQDLDSLLILGDMFKNKIISDIQELLKGE